MLVTHFCQVQTHLPQSLLSGNLIVNVPLYIFLGYHVVSNCLDGWAHSSFCKTYGHACTTQVLASTFHCSQVCKLLLEPQSSTFRCSGVTPQKDLNFRCWNCPHSSSYFQTGQHLWSAKLHTDSFVPDPRSHHYGKTGNYLTIMMYIQHNILRTSNPYTLAVVHHF
jgi:hypothetical protein